jgi:predicted PurR-regulated permease PerM
VTTPEAKLMRWRTLAYAAWAVIGVLVLLAASAIALNRISAALAPFVLAFFFVFFLQAPVNLLVRRGVSRGAATGICFAVAFLVVTLVLVFIIPPIARQLVEFANQAPTYLSKAQAVAVEMQERFSHVVLPDWIRSSVKSLTQSLSSMFVKLGDAVAKGLVSAGSGIATIVLDLFLGSVIAFWILKDLPKIRHEVRILAGQKYEADLENLITTVVRVVGGYLKGQTIASMVTGTLIAIGLAIVGVPYALVLGVMGYVLNYVPYAGPSITALVAAAVALFAVNPWAPLFAVAVVVLAQNITDTLVSPRVMSEQVDLHPTLVIFSLLAGGTLFGFWGMIFGIPVAATAKGLFVYYWELRTNRQLATENGALFRAAPESTESEPTSETPASDGADGASKDESRDA